jgi:hypothetical protein
MTEARAAAMNDSFIIKLKEKKNEKFWVGFTLYI